MGLGVSHDIVSLLSDVILSLTITRGCHSALLSLCCPQLWQTSESHETYTNPTPIPSIGMEPPDYWHNIFVSDHEPLYCISGVTNEAKSFTIKLFKQPWYRENWRCNQNPLTLSHTHTHTHMHTHNIHKCTNPPLQVDAEEICSILQQAFQLVYTEATVQHLNESISAGERGSVIAATTPRQRQDKPAQETGQKHCIWQQEANNMMYKLESEQLR